MTDSSGRSDGEVRLSDGGSSGVEESAGDEVSVTAADDSPNGADLAEETVIDADAKDSSTVLSETPSGEEDPAEKTTLDPKESGQDTVVDDLRQYLPSVPREPDADESVAGGNSSSRSGRGTSVDVYGTSSAPGFGDSPAPSSNSSYARTETATLEPAMSPTTTSSSTKSTRRAERAELTKPAGKKKTPRKAHLQVARFEPWSVMKFSFIMSLVSFLVLFVAVAVLYFILSLLGVFDALTDTIRDLTSNDQGKSSGIDPASWFSAARVLGYTALIGTLNVLLITALATVWSVIYNMAADLVGGVEVTLKEADQ